MSRRGVADGRSAAAAVLRRRLGRRRRARAAAHQLDVVGGEPAHLALLAARLQLALPPAARTLLAHLQQLAGLQRQLLGARRLVRRDHLSDLCSRNNNVTSRESTRAVHASQAADDDIHFIMT